MAFWNNLPLNKVSDFFDLYAREFFSPLLDEKIESSLPRIEVHETEKNYNVRAELGEVQEEDIQLSLDDNCLILQTDSLYRTIPFHSDVADDSIVATFTDGILLINLVKKNDGTEKRKKIEINKSVH